MYGVIYKITNLLNGKPYVGQTSRTLEERFIEHGKAKTHLGKAIRKYGLGNFSVEVIEECTTSEQLNEREIFWIAHFNCKHPNGYNFTDGGEGTHGLTEESLKKLRSKRSPETVALMSASSKKRANTPEGKAQLDKARKSRWEKEKARPPEQRDWSQFNGVGIYPVLEAELVSRKIKLSTLAKHLNLSDWSVARKFHDYVKFSIEDAEAIRDFLQVDTPLEVLFSRSDGVDFENIFSNRRAEWSKYPVLKAELDRQKVKTAELAKHLGLVSQSVTRKLIGKVGITPEQKAAIRDFLQVDTPLDVLFSRSD